MRALAPSKVLEVPAAMLEPHDDCIRFSTRTAQHLQSLPVKADCIILIGGPVQKQTAQFLQSMPRKSRLHNPYEAHLAKASIDQSNTVMHVSSECLNCAFARKVGTGSLLRSGTYFSCKKSRHWFDAPGIIPEEAGIRQQRVYMPVERDLMMFKGEGLSVCGDFGKWPLPNRVKWSRFTASSDASSLFLLFSLERLSNHLFQGAFFGLATALGLRRPDLSRRKERNPRENYQRRET